MESTTNMLDWTLKQLRNHNSYNQKFIAEKLGITPQAYERKENKSRKFNADELYLLSNLFNFNMDDMYKIIKN